MDKTLQDRIGMGISVALLAAMSLVYNHSRARSEGDVVGLQWYRSARFEVRSGNLRDILQFEGISNHTIKLSILGNPLKKQLEVVYDNSGNAVLTYLGTDFQLRYDESAGLLHLVDTEN